MKIQVVKVWRDVRHGGGRSWLMIFALALGVWGLGSVAVSARILGPDLKQNFLGTAPPHAVVTLGSPGSIDPQALGATVEGAEYRDLALLRIEVRPDEWVPLWLFAVQDFGHENVARVVTESGAAVPPRGTMLIERDGLRISDLKTGSLAHVRSGSRKLEVEVSGIAFDPAQAPATQDHFIYAYTDEPTWAALSGQEPRTRLVVRLRGVHARAEVERAVATLHLPGNAAIAVGPFEEHPHQWQLDLLMGIIGSIGLLALLLSAVMVSQVVSALLARQVRQVGIQKALGASSLRIFGLYALYLLILAVAAGAGAVPLAAATGQRFASFVARILNFEVLTTSVPAETWALLIGVALALPFLFAAPTLIRAALISVRRALADAPASPSTSGPTRGSWALRNVMRRPGRAWAVLSTTALGVAIFSTGFNIRESLAEFLGSTRDAMRFDVQVVLVEPVGRATLAAPFSRLLGIERREVWTGGRGELQSQVAKLDDGVGVVALPFDTTMLAPRLLAGRWLRSANEPEVVLNHKALGLLGQPKLGDTIRLRIGGEPRLVHVVGLAEEIDKAKVYVSDELWAAWADPQRRGNTLSLVARDRTYAGVMALKKEVERAVAASDLKVLYVLSQAERTKIIADHLDIILTVLLVLAFLVLWVAALGTAAASSITVMERTREIGVLRAIGAGPRRIVNMFVAEGMIASGAGLSLGLVAAWPLSLVAARFFGALMLGEGAVLRFAWSPAGTAITVAATLALAWLANRTPARAATRISTRQALAYE